MQPTKATLSFAVFGISYALAAADEIKRNVRRLSEQWNRAESVEHAANRLLDSVMPSGPGYEDSINAGRISDMLPAAAKEAGLTGALHEYRITYAVAMLDKVICLAPINSHQHNRAEALLKTLNKLLDCIARKILRVSSSKAERMFDALDVHLDKLYAKPVPKRLRGKDGRFIRAEAA
jgi:hypothetical protein